MRPQLTHIALQVRDIEASIRFYERFCGLEIVHDRTRNSRVVWLAEPGRGHELVLVLMPGAARVRQPDNDYSHFGFALGSRDEVDTVAKLAREDGCLAWEVREEPYPVGYFCGVTDPDGNVIELSYGQPLGPGAPQQS